MTFKDGFKIGLWMGVGGVLIIPGVVMVLSVVLFPFWMALIALGAKIGKRGLVQLAKKQADEYVHPNVNKEKERGYAEVAEQIDPEEWN